MNILQLGIGNILLTASTSADSIDQYSKTLLNTIIGGTVVVVLIFISIIIFLIKFIQRITNQIKPIENASGSAEQANLRLAVMEDEELIDDSELVAVITAAIMASMGNEAPIDGFVVRSIRRANNKKWQNA